MKYKNIISVIILLLPFLTSDAKSNDNICQIIKTELVSFIDTVKSNGGNFGKHSVYVLTIFDDNPDHFEFRVGSFSDVHQLEDIKWNYFAMVDSEIVLINYLHLQSFSLFQCISPQISSRESIVQIKKKLFGIKTFITGHTMYKDYTINDGKLTTVVYPSRE